MLMKGQVSLFWSFFIKRLNKNYFLIIIQSQKYLLLHWLRITQKFINRKEITLFYNETTPMWRNTIAGITTDQHIHWFSFCQNCTSFSGQWSCSIDKVIVKNKRIALLKYLLILHNANFFYRIITKYPNILLR